MILLEKSRLMVALSLAALMLSACSESVSTVSLSATNGASFVLSPPSSLTTRAVDSEQLYPEVSINDEPVEMTSVDGKWSGSLGVVEGRDASIAVLWFEYYNGLPLQLAEFKMKKTAVSGDVSITVNEADYQTSKFDSDNDGYSNLNERQENTDPFDANSPGENAQYATVRIGFIDPANPPVIDGTYDPLWGEGRAQFVNTDGENLLINNLMINKTGDEVGYSPNYQWGAMHDGKFLYIFVFGEGVGEFNSSLHTPYGDSVKTYNDDTLDIFLDGDNSKGVDYDDYDDIHILIPLLTYSPDPLMSTANSSGNSDSRIVLGDQSADLDLSAVQFSTCLCLGRSRSTWEIRIDLEAAKIPIGQTFGFELQIDDDIDGNERDLKWGWAHPARENNLDIDETWKHPSRMGNVRLEAAP